MCKNFRQNKSKTYWTIVLTSDRKPLPLKTGISCTNFYATIKQELQSGDTKIR